MVFNFLLLLKMFLNFFSQLGIIQYKNPFSGLVIFILVTEKSANYPLVWKYPSKNLITKVEEMECGSRLILPWVMNRYKILQSGYIDKVVNDWIHSTGKNEILKAISGVVLVSVFLDANRLRKKSILMDIISATNVYQPALYLQ
ncbi:hypothetical protein MKW92_029280 [Papaver armeniacum]|nr:hypothetical protein MKW92_029280 [Papaver armeniacum]